LSLSKAAVEDGIKDILFIHGKRTIPVQRARLLLERFQHSQSKHRTRSEGPHLPAPSRSQPMSA